MNRPRFALLFAPLALSLLLGATACSSPSSTPPSAVDNPDAGGGGGGAGGAAPDAGGPDLSEAIFNPEHVLDVVIDMAPADWDALRHQARSVSATIGEGCQDTMKPNPYTYFPATVTVDGEKLAMSGVRKKGFFGSASLSKPSLKVSFDEYMPGREYSGVEGLTLNNSRQDPSLVKTCLAFKAMSDAGVPSSRCNYARVTVNGVYMGVYVNVEPISKRFLARHFTDDTGNLYEGQLSDFRAGFMGSYEKKTNELDPDRSDLDAVTTALSASDAELEATLGKVLDIDAFLKYWAMEALLAAWDGYASNLNNHFVYHDPSSGKMSFIPWGPDMSFDSSDPFRGPNRPQSVSAKGAVSERLYEVPALQQRYVDTMLGLLDKSWNEADLLKEIDRIKALLAPHLGAAAPFVAAQADAVGAFVSGRRATIISEIKPTAPVWPFPAPAGACAKAVGKVTGTFSTTFDTLNQGNVFATGTGGVTLEIPVGSPLAAAAVGSAAGYENVPEGRRQVIVVGSFPNGAVRGAALFIDPEVFADGKDSTFDWQSAFGVGLDFSMPGQPQLLGFFGDGAIHFDKASTQSGAPVTGTFTSTILGGL